MKLQKWRPWVPLMPVIARAAYGCPLCDWRYTVGEDRYGRSVRARVRARLGAHLRMSHPYMGLRERSLLSDRVVESPPVNREGQRRKK
jgi:hypothetical protein